MKLLTCLAMLVLLSVGQAEEKKTADEIAKKIIELHTQRISTLKEATELSMNMAAAGHLELSEALEYQVMLFQAELDAALQETERKAIRQQTIASLKQLEEVAKARYENGRGTRLNLLRIKARRLEIELSLERANVVQPK